MKLELAKVAAAVESCVDVLAMRDWKLQVVLSTAEQMDEVMPGVGALAICSATPERHIATIRVLVDFPDHEDLMSTLMHELTHAKLSPLTSLIEFTPASAMLEEGIVESLGNALANTVPAYARAIRRALAAPRTRSPVVRARISALAPRRARKDSGMVDPSLKQKALEALLGDDMEALKEIVKALITDSGEPDGDEMPPPAREDAGATVDPPPPAREEQPPMGRNRSRQAPAASPHEARARRGADSISRDAIRMRIHTARTVDGFAIPAELEKKILRCSDIEHAEELLDVARIARGEGQSRARSGAGHEGAPVPDGGGPAAMTAAQLAAEGFEPAFIADYHAEHKQDPNRAAETLSGGRAARARIAARRANGAGRVGG